MNARSARLLLALGPILLSQGKETALAAEHKRFTYAASIGGPGLTVRSESMCLYVTTAIRSGEFFDGLEFNETPTGIEFRKRGARMEYFPTDTDIWVQFALSPNFCEPGTKMSFDENQARFILQSITFQLDWKQGADEKPVQNREPIKLIQGPTKGFHSPFFPGPFNGLVWTFLCRAASIQIPLTAHLEIKVYDHEKNLLARRTAIDLTSPPGPQALR